METTSYLNKLKFDPSLLGGLYARYIQNTRLVILSIIMLVLLGISSYSSLPRVLNPEIKIPIVIVSTVMPGASPKDIESLVTVPIEDSVSGLQKVKTTTSSSRDSLSIVTLEFESGIDPEKAKNDVKSAVDTVTKLPKDAKTPNVQKLDFTNEPVWTFTLSSKEDSLSLVRFGKTLRDNLKDLGTIDKVQTTGLENEDLEVLVKPEAISTYGINPIALSQTIQAATGSFPGGSVNTQSSSFLLSIDPTVTTIEDLRKLRIHAGGTTVLLSDVADIQRRARPDAADSYIAGKNQPPVTTVRFDVYKTSSANITKAVDDATKLTKKMTEQYHGQFTVSSIINSGDKINQQFYDLVRDLGITVILVFLTLFIFLGMRQAVVASMAIPATFLFTFTVMNGTGIALSFIAFFSFLLSLGLLVDDTIVVISAFTAYFRTGKFTPLEAGLLVWRDFKTAIFTSTLTTVWAFVPLLLASGIIGEFIKPIPIIVSATLLGSFIVAMFLTLPFIVVLLNKDIPKRVVILLRLIGLFIVFEIFMAIAPKGTLFLPALILFAANLFIYFTVKQILLKKLKERTNKKLVKKNALKTSRKPLSYYVDHGIISFEVIGEKYRRILGRILATSKSRRKAVIAVALFSFVSYLLVPLGFVRNEFFPKSDQNFLYISIELPAGTKLAKTKNEALKILDDVRKIPDIDFATATMRLGVDPGRGYADAEDNNALITMVLPEKNKRKMSSMDIAEELRKKYETYKTGKLSVIEATDGPPAGSDVQIKLSGSDLSVLDSYANKIQDYLSKEPGITNISKSIKPGTSKIVFIPDYQKMLDAGVTQDQLGLWMRTYASGFTLQEDSKLEVGSTDSQNIVFRTSAEPQSVSTAESLLIPTGNGPLPLSSLGTFTLRTNPTLITREDGKRTISVSAGITKGQSATEKNKKLEDFADSLNLPDGYSWGTGGANEENQNSVNSILQAMLLSFLLIIITMVLQFSSFRKALIVMLVIPLSISGVFIIFALTRTPLSFPALIGVLALFGIVVKNSILVVDKINQNLRSGLEFKQAIVEASESRLEPIALTSFAAIVGLVPITLSDPLWRGLGGAIISGLFFSGSIMLFFIPVVYYLIFQNSEGKSKK